MLKPGHSPEPGHLHPPSELPGWASEFHGLPAGRPCSRTLLGQELGRRSLEWGPDRSLVSRLADQCLGPWRPPYLRWGLGLCGSAWGPPGVLGLATPLVSHTPGQPDQVASGRVW